MGDDRAAIVGIGASAGGIDAFRRFFENMPADSGMAFVIILHLPANRRSMLPEIIARWTPMPVVDAGDGELIQANHVYVPPPHSTATLLDGRLQIRSPPDDPHCGARQIDAFFESLATNMREAAIGMVLSGSGSDGSLGLKAIKECGGFTLAQGVDGASPQYDEMPSGAIATGFVDLTARVEEMPAHLIRINKARLAAEAEAEQDVLRETNEARLEVCTILRMQVGHDFSGYKDKTFLRRVQRRMQVLGIDAVAAYVDRLREGPDEVDHLFRDLLIRVTSFFRDVEAFDILYKVAVPKLFENKSPADTVRIWVPGCATGEEAYSLAILMVEYRDGLRKPPKIQVFATDIDGQAIRMARSGRYPATALANVAAARRQRFFTATPNGYTVAKEIRELCTFSEHSLVRDPPFSRMNLVSCRNLLIYLDLSMQTVVISAFHYALAAGGIVLLGSSETTSRHEELFETLDKTAHIFLRRDVKSDALRIFAKGGEAKPDLRTALPKAVRNAVPFVGSRHRQPAPAAPGDTIVTHAQVSHAATGSPQASRFDKLRNFGFKGLFSRQRVRAETLAQLQDELLDIRGKLQSLTEQHETALEELRSSNEELQSVNEEFQSTNEELETSKEEIQSVNEELHTVNAQLNEKLDELAQTNSDLKNVFESTDVATIFLDRHMVVRGYTPAVGTIYNLIPSDQGRPLTDIVNHLSYQGIRDDVREVLDTLKPLERQVTHEDGHTHYIMRVLPYRGPNSEVNGTLVTFIDVTSIVQAERHQRLLVDELNHRVKNMLTVVISLATQTMRRASTIEEFSAAFMGRVQGLTASYTLLSGRNWENVSLQDVLEAETRPFFSSDGRNFQVKGPVVMLTPQGALAMGLAFHELATNAAKYGALSLPEGLVRVMWRVDGRDGEQELILQWREENGPEVALPSRRGFGMSLIERGFAHELSGRANVEFASSGVEATLYAPLNGALSLAATE